MLGRFAAVAAAMLLVAVLAAGAAVATTGPPALPPGLALFEGKQIDLAHGWGEAQACLVDATAGIVECFRDRSGLLNRELQLQTGEPAAPTTAAASCSTPLRLYADSNYGGRELDFYDRGYWQDLSTWGFDNQLSSYRVGACSVYLADGASGGGTWYPGNTSAGHNEAVMLSGWNDRISSIFIQ